MTLGPAVVNGQPGFRSLDAEAGWSTSSASTSRAACIRRVHSMLNPDKLGHLGPVSDLGLRPGGRDRARPPDSTNVHCAR